MKTCFSTVMFLALTLCALLKTDVSEAQQTSGAAGSPSATTTIDCKYTRTGVDDLDYHLPFRFTGKLDKLTIKPGPQRIVEADRNVIQPKLAGGQEIRPDAVDNMEGRRAPQNSRDAMKVK